MSRKRAEPGSRPAQRALAMRRAGSTVALSKAALARATLARQMLLERSDSSPLGAIEHLFALQAQLPRPPFVGLWTRLERFTRESLLELLHGRQVVRAPLLRRTLHLVSAADFLAARGLLQPVLHGALSYVRSYLERLDLDRLLATARELLAERPHSFHQLRRALSARGLEADERAMGLAVRMCLPLVQLPSAAKWGFDSRACFALGDEWLGRVRPGPMDARDLVRRYLAAFGPASVADASAWSGLKGLRPVFDALRPELMTLRDERGRELFDLPDAPRPPEDLPTPVRFLPEYDNLVLGHQDRSRFVAAEHRARLITRNLQVPPTFLVEGRVAGSWRVEARRHRAALLLTPFSSLPAGAAAPLEEEGLRLLGFLEAERAPEIRFER